MVNCILKRGFEEYQSHIMLLVKEQSEAHIEVITVPATTVPQSVHTVVHQIVERDVILQQQVVRQIVERVLRQQVVHQIVERVLQQQVVHQIVEPDVGVEEQQVVQQIVEQDGVVEPLDDSPRMYSYVVGVIPQFKGRRRGRSVARSFLCNTTISASYTK
uniref:Uncharacterized protein n=1 Tax=Panagrolaimus superbus TaxID=310955 RepID=A0A914YQI5_9BILA